MPIAPSGHCRVRGGGPRGDVASLPKGHYYFAKAPKGHNYFAKGALDERVEAELREELRKERRAKGAPDEEAATSANDDSEADRRKKVLTQAIPETPKIVFRDPPWGRPGRLVSTRRCSLEPSRRGAFSTVPY